MSLCEENALDAAVINVFWEFPSTYDHRVWKTGLPVRSAVLKPHAGRLVVGWVTTSESRLLYVFFSSIPTSLVFFISICHITFIWQMIFYCCHIMILISIFLSTAFRKKPLTHVTHYRRYLVAATTIWSGLSYVFSKDAVKILTREEIQKRIAAAAARRKSSS